jgi:hypothetical protein
MKDAKGHGSEARGGSGALSRDDLAKQVAFVKAAGKAATPAQEAWLLHAQDRLNYGRGEPRVGGPGMKGAAMGSVASNYWSAKSLANIGGGQPVASNAHAAATLASGPKSDSVPVHGGASGRDNEYTNGRNAAIDGSYRSENPHSVGTAQHESWSAGHSGAIEDGVAQPAVQRRG